MVLNSPFTKTLHIDFPPLPLWCSLSELSEMLPPKLQSSFCPNYNLTRNSQVVHLFFFLVDIRFLELPTNRCGAVGTIEKLWQGLLTSSFPRGWGLFCP